MAGLAQYTRHVAAGLNSKLSARGSMVSLYSITGATACTLKLRQNEVGEKAGETYSLSIRKFEKWFLAGEYDEVEIINDSTEDILVTLLLGFGDFVREVTSRSEVPENWRNYMPTELAATTANYAEAIDANGLRSRIIVRNKDSGVGSELRLQHSGPTEDEFITLLEGEQYVFNHKGSIWCRTQNGAGLTFQWDVMEEFFDA